MITEFFKLAEDDAILIECSKDVYYDLFNTHKSNLVIGKTCTLPKSKPHSQNYRMLAHTFTDSNDTFIMAERDGKDIKYYHSTVDPK